VPICCVPAVALALENRNAGCLDLAVSAEALTLVLGVSALKHGLVAAALGVMRAATCLESTGVLLQEGGSLQVNV
jgi:hypothetical protein